MSISQSIVPEHPHQRLWRLTESPLPNFIHNKGFSYLSKCTDHGASSFPVFAKRKNKAGVIRIRMQVGGELWATRLDDNTAADNVHFALGRSGMEEQRSVIRVRVRFNQPIHIMQIIRMWEVGPQGLYPLGNWSLYVLPYFTSRTSVFHIPPVPPLITHSS